MWRWDQGRLLYFQFNVLREMAGVLAEFDNTDIKECDNAFRECLERRTGMPFLPKRDAYAIKRNYSRVFQCGFLANFVGGKLVVTDICRDLAEGGRIQNADDFFFNYVRRFRFPFPAFKGYNATEERAYPFCAIIKFLISLAEKGEEPKLSIDDIFNYIIANNCNGAENIEFYKTLSPKSYEPSGTKRRQLREMVIFVSQLSILKYFNGILYLDDLSGNERCRIMEDYLTPENIAPEADPIEEFYRMTSLETGKIVLPSFDTYSANSVDIEFTEGDRKRVEHFRIERSRLLRKYYHEKNPDPVCPACQTDVGKRYPWTDYMLEIHHLMPLSSSMAVSLKGTSLDDIVGLCPSCHRAVHLYYNKWLKTNEQSDFKGKAEARDVFVQATKEIVL